MWPFFKKAQARKNPDNAAPLPTRRRPMKFAELIASMGDFSDLAVHDVALKFWLPEPADEALKEIAGRAGESISVTLRRFFAQHCYGVYACEVMSEAASGLFKDVEQIPTMFRIGGGEDRPMDEPQPHKVRVDTYWVPELGKNVAPIKVWVPARIRTDLGALSEHNGIKLSQYVREIVISRLLGHGMLPSRPDMLTAAPLASADEWCEGKDVPMRQVSAKEFWEYGEGEVRTEQVEEEAR